MLRRQRTVLRVLAAADGTVAATQLQKLLFLLSEETFLGKDGAFYEFLPFKFGAYSFAVQRETEGLRNYGYIRIEGTSMAATDLGVKEAATIDPDTARAVLAVTSQYAKKPLKALLKDVYARYPWYAIKSELKEIVPSNAKEPPAAPVAVYTAGYESLSIDGFLNNLLRKGISRIIDVRANPISRKYGFARSSLSNLAEKVGIAYCHFPSLGIPSSKRQDIETSFEFLELFKYYERQILPTRTDDLLKVANLISSSPSTLVCMEREAVDCHRSRLASHIASFTKLNVVHL